MNKYATYLIQLMNEELTFDKWTPQIHLIELANKHFNRTDDNVRSNSFRNIRTFFDDEINNFEKTIIKGKNHWRKSHTKQDHFNQHFNKLEIPIYVEALNILKSKNHSKNYVLAGSNSSELSIFDRDKLILVDTNKNYYADMYIDITKITESAGYVLDYCSVLTMNKINHINKIEPNSSIILEIQSSKKFDKNINLLTNCKVVEFGEYVGKSNKIMKIYLIQK